MGTYKVLEVLGQGGMGVVHRAIQVNLDREVAIKFIRLSNEQKHRARTRFLREVQVLTRISHPNVMRVLDHGEIDGQLFYAMELLRGRTLRQLMDELGPLPVPRFVPIARQLLEALACVHQAGIIHRDLKPANIMLGDADHLTLMDFGLAKDPEATLITGDGTIVGTPAYLSPEAVVDGPVDARSDLFSLGAVLYEALSGTLPFGHPNVVDRLTAIVRQPHRPIQELRPDIPGWLASFVDRLLAKAPDDRFASAPAALHSLRRGLGESVDEEPSGPKVHPPTGAGRPRPRLPGRAAAIAGLAVALLAAGLVVFRPGSPPPPHRPVTDPDRPGVPTATRNPSPPALPEEQVRAEALTRALRSFDPVSRLQLIRDDLAKIRRNLWFAQQPNPEMTRLRTLWGSRLATLVSSTSLALEIDRFRPHTDRFFTTGSNPDDRLDLYLRLHDLLSLWIYCQRFQIPLAFDASGAFSRLYGQSLASRLGSAPTVCLDFVPTREHEDWVRSAAAAVPGDWTRLQVPASERFHTAGDFDEVDVESPYTPGKDVLEYHHPAPLPLPPLSRIEALEVGAYLSDLHKSVLFVVSLSTDGRSFRRMAVFRDSHRDPPHPYWHGVDLQALRGEALHLKVNFVVIPQMDAYHEYALLSRLLVRYRPRGARPAGP